MKSNELRGLSLFLSVLFGLATVIVLTMTYFDLNGEWVFPFLIGYVFLTFFMLLYVPIVTLIQVKHVQSDVLRKKVRTFLVSFFLFLALGHVTNLLFFPQKADLLYSAMIAFGVAFGSSFVETIFFKNTENKKDEI